MSVERGRECDGSEMIKTHTAHKKEDETPDDERERERARKPNTITCIVISYK